MSKWNEIPTSSSATPQQKADEFDRQFEENKNAGNDKEESGKYRPEPNGRAN
jgi:hypothetical protein